jgi:hypothetical protein
VCLVQSVLFSVLVRIPDTEQTCISSLYGSCQTTSTCSTSSYLIAQECMFTGVLLPVVRCLQLDHMFSLNPTVSGWQFLLLLNIIILVLRLCLFLCMVDKATIKAHGTPMRLKMLEPGVRFPNMKCLNFWLMQKLVAAVHHKVVYGDF